MTAPAFTEADFQMADSLLQNLLRVDTTNPPGNEGVAAEMVAKELVATGLEPVFSGAIPDRPNLTASWQADPAVRSGRPLVLSCHLDVVPAEPSRWTHPPFSGHNDGTYIWGRGAIDMKGFAVMGLAAIAKLRQEKIPIRRDVIFAAVCDEEAGTRLGSSWLVDERPDLLGGDPEYVINEVGGFTLHRGGRRYYPVQVAEKGVAWIRLTVTGRPGHSSLPVRDTAVARLARAIDIISSSRLPWHPSAEATRFLAGFARGEGRIAQWLSPLLAHPSVGPRLIDRAIPEPGRRASVEAILRNTANPTCLQGGTAINTVPGEAWVDIDGRLAPGQSSEDLLRELERIVKPVLRENYRFEVLHTAPPISFSTDTPLYREIESTLLAADPDCHVVPSIIPGFTDSQNYARLGATCYGFYPLQLPADLDFAALFHGDDERIPIRGFHWGIEVLTKMLRKFLTEE